MDEGATPKIVIGICTRQRNKLLRRLLDTIWVQPDPPGYLVEIVIVDNNDIPAAAAAIVGLSDRFQITIVHEAKAGLVHARNRALDTASAKRATYFIGIDDDEWVAPDWLAQHINGFETLNAEVIVGPTKFVYDDSLSKYLSQRQMPELKPGKAPAILACGNFALRRLVFDVENGAGLRFDPAFNESGGEDYDFMLRAKRLHNWWPEGWPHPMAFEECKHERATLRYHLTRARRAQYLVYVVARRHRIAGYRGSLAQNIARILFQTNRHIVLGIGGLVGGTLTLAFNNTKGCCMIGAGLMRFSCAFAVFPYMLRATPKMYGQASNASL